MSNFVKIFLVEAELFHMNRLPERERETDRQTDRQTDMTMLIVAFRNSSNAPKIILQIVNCRDAMFG
jgi:hypothetical protein